MTSLPWKLFSLVGAGLALPWACSSTECNGPGGLCIEVPKGAGNAGGRGGAGGDHGGDAQGGEGGATVGRGGSSGGKPSGKGGSSGRGGSSGLVGPGGAPLGGADSGGAGGGGVGGGRNGTGGSTSVGGGFLGGAAGEPPGVTGGTGTGATGGTVGAGGTSGKGGAGGAGGRSGKAGAGGTLGKGGTVSTGTGGAGGEDSTGVCALIADFNPTCPVSAGGAGGEGGTGTSEGWCAVGGTAGDAGLGGAPSDVGGTSGSGGSAPTGGINGNAGTGSGGGATTGGRSSGGKGGTGSGGGAAMGSGASAAMGGGFGGPSRVLFPVDDLDDGDVFLGPVLGARGAWYLSSDGSGSVFPSSACVEASPATGFADHPSAFAMHTYGKGISQWAQLGISFHSGPPACDQPIDATGMTGVRFWAKGTSAIQSVAFKVATTDSMPPELGGTCLSNCYQYFGVAETLDDTWREYVVPFSSLYRAGYEVVDASTILNLMWQAGDRLSQTSCFDFWVDDVAFYKDQ